MNFTLGTDAGFENTHSQSESTGEPDSTERSELSPTTISIVVAEAKLAWLGSFWVDSQRKRNPHVAITTDDGLITISAVPAAAETAETFRERWEKAVAAALKKVEQDDLGDMGGRGRSMREQFPPDGLAQLATLERELSVKVCFCANGRVLLCGAKAKLLKKCLPIKNLLSHYLWRLSGKDAAFDDMTG